MKRFGTGLKMHKNVSASKDTEIDWELPRSGGGRVGLVTVSDSTVTRIDLSQAPALPDGFGLLDDFIAELESDPENREGFAAARRELATEMGEDNISLPVLRLRAGLSQSELAKAIGTSQAAVSRIEAGEQEPRLETLRKLSAALGVDMNTLNQACPA